MRELGDRNELDPFFGNPHSVSKLFGQGQRQLGLGKALMTNIALRGLKQGMLQTSIYEAANYQAGGYERA